MNISSLYLDAFYELSQARSFSKASKNLFITQSALSQRIAKFEEDLGTTLVLREKGNLVLTDAGEKVLAYCEIKKSLENELLENLLQDSSEFVGELRVFGFSTIMRSRLIPKLSSFLRENPKVQVSIGVKELRELELSLRTGEAHFVITSEPINKVGVICELIGDEDYYLVESKNYNTPSTIYLDHDHEDNTTLEFLKKNKVSLKKIQRKFFDDIYALIEGVEEGLGVGVVPQHLIMNNKKLKKVKGLKSLRGKVYLCYREKTFYSSLHKKIIELIKKDGL